MKKKNLKVQTAKKERKKRRSLTRTYHPEYKIHISTHILYHAEYILYSQWYNSWRTLISLCKLQEETIQFNGIIYMCRHMTDIIT